MPDKEDRTSPGMVSRLAGWFDERLGLSHPLLRPVPQYAVNPFYWLGALAVVAFVIQGVTGMLMMLYYVPSLDQAYTTTQYIFSTVAYGQFLETVHLYTAYAMIMLAFMHMMRGYFVSVHKRPREAMWVVGMLMGFVTLGFGFTGYLLPWTVVSKSATDVGVGMIDALPPPVSSFIKFLVIGAGSDATELLRFFDLHVVVLPAVLLVLLVAKMYMLEAHGISGPTSGEVAPKKRRLVPIFPDVTLYLLELAALFGVGMMFLSVVFPLDLPPQYSPTAAANYTPQPDWYFLWIYQILKLSVFEGTYALPGGMSISGLEIALTVVTLILVLLVLLPFIDRKKEVRITRRPLYTTLGVMFVAEIAVLAFWGEVTPGQVIPIEQGLLILGGTALIIGLVSAFIYRLIFSRIRAGGAGSITRAQAWSGFSFAFVVGLGALALGGTFNSVVSAVYGGLNPPTVASLVASLGLLAISVMGSIYLLYRFDLATGSVRRRVGVLEVGWNNED